MTSLLLDTQALLWLLGDSRRMGGRARALIASADGVHYSAASVWEIQIKSALGKLRLDGDLGSSLRSSRLQELPVTAAHALAIPTVTLPHGDPFDRMLLTQANEAGLTFLTADAILLGLGRADVLDAGA
ncbi:MAG: type II toxin-antitoxin system VapC family toxin [Actinobacteria bacterium]|nr:type II toxin-antitoxin system VapC family toxin [Actinomycetota bacterium]